MSKKLSDEEKQLNKEARATASAEAKAKVKAEELMADVAALLPGDTFTLDEVGYVVLSIDSQSGHIHTNLLDGEETPGAHGSVDFGTMVDVITRAEVEEEVAVAPAPAASPGILDINNPAVSGGRVFTDSVAPKVPLDTNNPAVTGGRWFK